MCCFELHPDKDEYKYTRSKGIGQMRCVQRYGDVEHCHLGSFSVEFINDPVIAPRPFG